MTGFSIVECSLERLLTVRFNQKYINSIQFINSSSKNCGELKMYRFILLSDYSECCFILFDFATIKIELDFQKKINRSLIFGKIYLINNSELIVQEQRSSFVLFCFYLKIIFDEGP